MVKFICFQGKNLSGVYIGENGAVYYPALVLAASVGSVEIVKLLITHGIYINIGNVTLNLRCG